MLQVIEAGANALVAGSAVFGAPDYKEGKSLIHTSDLSCEVCAAFCYKASYVTHLPAGVLCQLSVWLLPAFGKTCLLNG